MRIIFFGTPDEAAGVLERLIEAKREIIGVVTQPDRPSGRGLKVKQSPVKSLAIENGIPVMQPENLRDKSFEKMIKSLKADIGAVVAYGKIIPKEVLDIPRHGFINVHASLLPKYRGAAPIQWALIKGEEETGVTIFKLTEVLDAGAVITQKKVSINDSDDAGSLSDRIFRAGGSALLEALDDIERGKAKFAKQDEKAVSYAPKILRESGALDWRQGEREIFNRIRAMNPHPGAFTYHKKKLLKIWTASPAGNPSDEAAQPGAVIDLQKNSGFAVRTRDGSLLIKEVQPESKKRMSAWDFVLGHRLKKGEILPS